VFVYYTIDAALSKIADFSIVEKEKYRVVTEFQTGFSVLQNKQSKE
jgi:hypothetical protein